jgi:hypothetical protein
MKRTSPLTIALLSAILGCTSLLAQTPSPTEQPAPGSVPAPPPPANTDLSSGILEWVPPVWPQLAAQAVAKESFTFDRTMLTAASALMSDNDADVRQTVAKLDGVSVHTLRYSAPGTADPGQVDAVRQAYHLRGWKHVVSSTTNSGGPVHTQTTDVWLVLDGANVRGAVVLVESPKSLTLASLAGNLSPVDLMRLRGHFHIPNFDIGGMSGDKDK